MTKFDIELPLEAYDGLRIFKTSLQYFMLSFVQSI